MKILVISDTHGEDENFEELIYREAPFDMLIHCGDVEGREEYIEMTAECPVYMVAGNCDYFSDLPGERIIEIGKHRALITHGHYYKVSWDLVRLAEAAREKNCDLAFFGHIHVPVDRQMYGVRCINPGSLSLPRQANGIPTYVVIEVDEDGQYIVEACLLD